MDQSPVVLGPLLGTAAVEVVRQPGATNGAMNRVLRDQDGPRFYRDDHGPSGRPPHALWRSVVRHLRPRSALRPTRPPV